MGRVGGGKDSALTRGDLPGTPGHLATHTGKAWLNRQESAEAILPVPDVGDGEGLSLQRGKESDEFEQGTTTAANPARELTTEGSGESAQSREAPNLHNGFIHTQNPLVADLSPVSPARQN
jgi:hypothetical protein